MNYDYIAHNIKTHITEGNCPFFKKKRKQNKTNIVWFLCISFNALHIQDYMATKVINNIKLRKKNKQGLFAKVRL